MSNWQIVKLIEVAEVQTGISKSSQRRLKSPIELPYLRVANVQDGFLDLEEIKTIEIERGKFERYSLKYGDVLLTEGGDFDKLGRGTIWRDEIKDCVHQNHVFVVRPKKKELLPEYLSLLTSSDYGRRHFIKCSKQSTNLASINSTQLKAFPVLLPEIDLQQEIVKRASIWDTAIEKTEALIDVKERQFGWLQKSLMQASSDDWSSCALEEISKVKKGQQLNRDTLDESGQYPVWNGGITPSGFTDKQNTPSNTITISEGGNSCGFVNYCNEGFWLGGHCYALEKIDAEIFSQFLFFFLEAKERNIMRLRVGSGLPNIQKKDIEKLEVRYPGLEEQKHIADTLNTAKQEINLLKKLADQYRTQKRGLMQKLLSGEWHIKNKEVA